VPYTMTQTKRCPDGKPWAVVKQDTGAVVPGGCHETREKAQAHLAALQAAASKEKRG
jgi:hypothetical protein